MLRRIEAKLLVDISKRKAIPELVDAMVEKIRVFGWQDTELRVHGAVLDASSASGVCLNGARLVDGAVRLAALKRLDKLDIYVTVYLEADADADADADGCYYCVLKHLGQAAVLCGEVDYPLHKVYAYGHLAEAERETGSESLRLSIREARLLLMTAEQMPDWLSLFQEAIDAKA